MNKGLGRGLSSLFAVYEDEKDEKVEQKPILNTKNEKKEPEILTNADNLLEKYKTKTVNAEEVNTKFTENTNVLKQKLEKVEKEVYEGNTARQIPISKLIPNAEQPRKTFNQEALNELAQSIKEHGVIQPIVAVVKGDNYMIIAGERRFRASKIAGLKTVPVIIRDYTEQQIREIALIENLQREDLNPVESAIAVKQLIDLYGYTQDEVANKLGKSRPAITNMLRLLSLQPEVLTLVEKGRLLPAIARAIITLPAQEQVSLAKKASDNKMTAREVEQAVQDMTQPEKIKTKQKSTLSIELISLKDDMQQVFGTKVSILGNNKKGRIYFDYYNQDDLDRIYNLINRLK